MWDLLSAQGLGCRLAPLWELWLAPKSALQSVSKLACLLASPLEFELEGQLGCVMVTVLAQV